MSQNKLKSQQKRRYSAARETRREEGGSREQMRILQELMR